MRSRGLASALLVMVSAGAAHAQAIDAQNFQPAATTTGLTTVKGGAAEGAFVPTLSLTSVYVRDPLVLVDSTGKQGPSLVKDRVDLVLAYAMGLDAAFLEGLLFRGIDVAAVVPFVPYQGQG